MEVDIGVFFALLAALGLAGQALTVRVATQRGRASDVLLIVMMVNTGILVAIAAGLVRNPVITPRSFLAFAAAGIIGTMAGRAFFYAGIKRVGASRAEPIKASMPFHATILAIIILGESVTGPQFLGVLLIIGGIAIVTWEGSADSRFTPEGIPWIGLSFPFIAAFLFGMEPIFASIGFAEGTSILVGLVIKSVAALTTYFAYLAWRGLLPTISELREADFRWYIFAGIANTVFLLAYYAGLSVSSVAIVVPIMQASPLIVVFVSALFLKKLERVTPLIIIGAGVIVAGGVLITLST